MPTISRSPSRTISLTWPIRGGGGNTHWEQLGTCLNADSSRQFAPLSSLTYTWAGSAPTRTTSRPISRPPRADHKSTWARPSLVQVHVYPPSVLLGDANTMCCREERSVGKSRNRADEAAGKRLLLDRPAAARTLDQEHTINRTDNQPVDGPFVEWMFVPAFDNRIIRTGTSARTAGFANPALPESRRTSRW